jgi:hypothetical protein
MRLRHLPLSPQNCPILSSYCRKLAIAFIKRVSNEICRRLEDRTGRIHVGNVTVRSCE